MLNDLGFVWDVPVPAKKSKKTVDESVLAEAKRMTNYSWGTASSLGGAGASSSSSTASLSAPNINIDGIYSQKQLSTDVLKTPSSTSKGTRGKDFESDISKWMDTVHHTYCSYELLFNIYSYIFYVIRIYVMILCYKHKIFLLLFISISAATR